MASQDCDCLKNSEETIVNHISGKKDNPKGFKITESYWENKTWYPKQRLYANYIIQSTFEKKDGSISKPKNSHVVIHFTYCPFCGKKFDESGK